MDPKTLQLLMGSSAAGAVADKNYIEDVFSTWLYTGNGSTQTITNGIDLSTKGGLTWIKSRSGTTGHRLTDTVRGATKSIASNLNSAETTESAGLTAFTTSGFSIGADVDYNTNSTTYVSWSFREQAKFFDIVTYTGNGVAGRTINHNLGSTPGWIIIKNTSQAFDWLVWHRSSTGGLFLNTTDNDQANAAYFFGNGSTYTAPTSTTFTLGNDGRENANGNTYVAYIFAHDAGGFGDSGNDNVISCGSYTGNGSTNGPTVTLGWEPQWLLVKNVAGVSGGSDWSLTDTLRGFTVNSANNNDVLFPNNSIVEQKATRVNPLSTGFKVITDGFQFNQNGDTYIYIAIRRGPMKTPTDATKVFNATVSSGAEGTQISAGFPLDTQFIRFTGGADSVYVVDRLRGVSTVNSSLNQPYFFTDSTTSEFSATLTRDWNSNGFDTPAVFGGTSTVYLNFRRAAGFFDVVAYTGDGSSNRAIAHNLSVTPELIIVKSRNSSGSWRVWSAAFANTSANLDLNGNGAPPFANNLFPASGRNSSNFIVNGLINTANTTYIAYLFASCPGVSKTGSYTGTGTTLNVDCGFTNGARFVIIKRTDSTGDWYGWDTARGIVSGNDPYFLFNSPTTPITNTDYIDPLSSGFQISSTAPVAINASGGSYIYLSVA
jgi:hypothetical protein